MPNRLITCQGSAQLVTALSVIAARDRDSGLTSIDFLVIYGLAVNKSQEQDFVTQLKNIANSIHPFRHISYLADEEVDTLWEQSFSGETARHHLNDLIGTDSINEVYVVRDWQKGNELILKSFPHAKHICYGDSVGVYFSRPQSIFSRLVTRLREVLQGIEGILRKQSLSNYNKIDLCYLLLPNAFSTPPCSEVIQTDPIYLIQTYEKMLPLIKNGWNAYIKEKVENEHVWVFMGSNFTEQGLMALDQEISAYKQWMLSLAPVTKRYKLLIKSHPRDMPLKQKMMIEALKDDFLEIISIDEAASAYLPVEVLLLKLQEYAKHLECLCVSTACLGSSLVLGLPTRIGIGSSLVSRYFPKKTRSTRIEHEIQLEKLCLPSLREQNE
jgi:hypothetical protein